MQRRPALLALLLTGSGLAWPQDEVLLDVNRASRAQLESLDGLGPVMVERLLAARQRAPFADWADLRRRVAGIGPALARRLSQQGLRVGTQPFAADLQPVRPAD
ncbi:helix-hairpin-helix domain-containing protein [Paucibacter sp. APW11]|uniref:Helix-hairpin-helix domain-containing protein n=1 Tax=Roseateles aquae TaxID=3077235 RepID=A0ABU3P8K9_9BURK|nr:helix-hairpin-helix domain-containing protein [Paucibacter sp. APW11]MDT8998081.1 helix-hairpin-helix domain-containing protein [Paucibacter sp. APW11]